MCRSITQTCPLCCLWRLCFSPSLCYAFGYILTPRHLVVSFLLHIELLEILFADCPCFVCARFVLPFDNIFLSKQSNRVHLFDHLCYFLWVIPVNADFSTAPAPCVVLLNTRRCLPLSYTETPSLSTDTYYPFLLMKGICFCMAKHIFCRIVREVEHTVLDFF